MMRTQPIHAVTLTLGLMTVMAAVLTGLGGPGPAAAEPSPPRAPTISADRLLPLEPRRGVFRITEGDEKGAEVAFNLDRHDDLWALSKAGRARHFLRRQDDGDIVIDHEQDLRKGLRVEYDPPVLLLPAEVRPGETHRGESRIVTRRMSDGSVRHRGRCVYTVEVRGRRAVHTAAGAFDAYILRATRHIDLGVPHIDLEIEFAYAADKGQVAETVNQRITAVLGLWREKSRWRMERAE